jgi:hypothetical protein
MKYQIELSENELEEVLCKLANELEDYNDDSTSELKSSFVKIYKLANTIKRNKPYTTLVKKWAKKLKCQNMQNLNTIPTLREKQEATNSFQHYFNMTKESYKIPSYIKYNFALSHDGIILWNKSSNSIGFNELLLITNFCDNSNYSFSCSTRNTENKSCYGGISIEINICR